MDMIFKVRFWFIGALLLNLSWKIEGQSWYDVRLVNGWTSNEGRVEIYYFGSWGTVCDDSFGATEADVVCQQLGYSYATNYYTSAYFGSGSGTIWLDNVDCTGIESSLSDCYHNGFGSHNCAHSEDVGVECYTSGGSSGYEDIRLVGGSLSSEGRVEVQYNGVWGTVCDDSWGSNEADVVCRQLGYTHAIEETVSAYFGQGSGTIWLDDVVCGGYESEISDCTHNGWGTHNCAHSEDAGVRCYDANYNYGYVGLGVAVIAGIAVGAILGCAFLVCIVVAICKGSSSSRSTTVITASTRNNVGPTTTYQMASHPMSSRAEPNGPPPSYDQVNKPSAYSNPHGAPIPPPPQQTFDPVGGHAPAQAPGSYPAPAQAPGSYPAPAQAPGSYPAPAQAPGSYPAPAWQQPPASSYPPPGASGPLPPPNPYANLPPLAQPAPVPQAYVPPTTNVPPPQQLY